MPAFYLTDSVEIFDKKTSLDGWLQSIRKEGGTIALVPTMGALHDGHTSLIRQARELADVVVCSIFVNPTQFNDPADLEKYPRPVEQDVAMLKTADCDGVFMPSVAEMYEENEQWHLALGGLDEVLEGAHRPGHYQGVTQIVKKLFDTVKPDWALFGQKDYQQYLVIQYMVKILHIPVKLQMCPIVREASGLAMSSRNVRLSATGKKQALALHSSLQWTTEHMNSQSPGELQAAALRHLRAAEGVEPEYFVICDGETLEEVKEWPAGDKKHFVALVAAWVEGVRLIDNVIFN